MPDVLLTAFFLAAIGVPFRLIITAVWNGRKSRPAGGGSSDAGEKYQRLVDEARRYGFAPGPQPHLVSKLDLVPAAKFHDLVLVGNADTGENAWLIRARRRRFGEVDAFPVTAVVETRGQTWPHVIIRPR